MWPSFAYVASLQGKGPSKRKQQRSCSWGREAVACLLSPAYGKQWIVWRTGLWQCNRRPAAAQRGLCFSTFTSPLCQYLPHREARTETPAELPPSQRNDVRPVWVLGSRSRWMLKVHETYLTPQPQPDCQLLRVQNKFTISRCLKKSWAYYSRDVYSSRHSPAQLPTGVTSSAARPGASEL